MTRQLRAMYREYGVIQGRDPILLGDKVNARMENRHYKDKTVRQVLGLLKEFIREYENVSEGRNLRYAVGIQFNRVEGHSGPFLVIVDVREDDKFIMDVLEWNHGEIKNADFTPEENAVLWEFPAKAVRQVRNKIYLSKRRVAKNN